MLSRPEPACLLIADISGYTGYLAGAELDHAQDILADLMGAIVRALRPGFRLAKLEGDAAFACAVGDTIDGSGLLDTVDRTYFAFRRRLRDIRQASSCRCQACTLIPRLDLKFIAHHGTVVRHRIAGREELVGSDVVVVHRLLKNTVVEALQLTAYACFTEACVAAMAIDPVALGMRAHEETYQDAGSVSLWVHDLEAAWQAELERARVVVSAQDAGYELESRLSAPRAVVWDWVTNPAKGPLWQAGVTAVEEQPTAPRRGVGTTNHCVHGADVLVEEILDWRPVDYFTTRTIMPNGLRLTGTFSFEEEHGGTLVRIRFSWGTGQRERETMAMVGGMLGQSMEAGQAALRRLLEDDAAAARRGAADPPEPEPPPSQYREVLEPIAG